jgi:DNA-binding SARP family transcriptional activator
MGLSIRLFGKFSVWCDGKPLKGFEAPKVRDLFAYLLVYQNRPHTRESIATNLWGDVATAQSMKCLRQTLWQLQSVLEADVNAESILLTDGEWVQLNATNNLQCDLAELEQAHGLLRSQANGLSETSAQAIEQALEQYQGDLLEGCHHEWCLIERERLQNICLALLDRLMEHAETQLRYDDGIRFGRRILSFDRARERTHRAMMRCQYLSGDRTAALRQYERCANSLKEELGVKPGRNTRELLELIQTDQNIFTTQVSQGLQLNQSSNVMLGSDLLRQLQHACSILMNTQRQLHREIQVVESNPGVSVLQRVDESRISVERP